MKNRFSISIIALKTNRTLGGVCFKIRQQKPNYSSAVDEKTENSLNFHPVDYARKPYFEFIMLKTKLDREHHDLNSR